MQNEFLFDISQYNAEQSTLVSKCADDKIHQVSSCITTTSQGFLDNTTEMNPDEQNIASETKNYAK